MVVKQIGVFLGLGGVFILQQLFLVPRGARGGGGVTAVCHRTWHLLAAWQEGIVCQPVLLSPFNWGCRRILVFNASVWPVSALGMHAGMLEVQL